MNRLVMSDQEYHEHMRRIMALYAEFDAAIQALSSIGRNFGPGTDEQFSTQLEHCQELRSRLVAMENLEDIKEENQKK